MIVKSVKLSQSVLDKETLTVGLNGIHGRLPVLPPTQLPQLSVHAVPLTSPLQSTNKQLIEKGKFCTSISPNSEITLELNVKFVGFGFTNKLVMIIVWLFPEVTLLLSGGEVATTSIPPPILFSIVNEP